VVRWCAYGGVVWLVFLVDVPRMFHGFFGGKREPSADYADLRRFFKRIF